MTDLFKAQHDLNILNQYPNKPHPSGSGYIIYLPYGELTYIPKFIDKKVADRTLQVLFENPDYDWRETNWFDIDVNQTQWTNIQWHQDTINMYGKEHKLPRVSAWYGDSEKSYKYSGILLYPKEWNKPLLWFKEQLKQISGIEFNSVLLNWYRNGDDYISWHTDAEPELGQNPTIGSLNFGETRRFLLRQKEDHSIKVELPLSHGDLLIMSGELQHHWQHSVPKQSKIKHGRLNMTFRVIKPRPF